MPNESNNYAVIVDGVVINAIVWDGNTDPSTGGIEQWPDGWTVVLFVGDAWIGWSYVDGEFIPPP